MNPTIERITGYITAILKIAASIALAVIWIYFAAYPTVRDFYLIKFTKPVSISIESAAEKKPENIYLKVEGIFIPKQNRKLVEVYERTGNFQPGKDIRNYFIFCNSSMSSCVYIGSEDLSWEPNFYKPTTITGLARDFGEKESMQLTFLDINAISEFERKNLVKPKPLKDGSYDWVEILKQYLRVENDPNKPLRAQTSYYIKKIDEDNQAFLIIIIPILTIFVLSMSIGLYISGKEDFMETRQG